MVVQCPHPSRRRGFEERSMRGDSLRIRRGAATLLMAHWVALVGLTGLGHLRSLAQSGSDGAASLDRVGALITEGRYSDAETLARQALADAEARHGQVSREAAAVLDALVQSLGRGGKARDPDTLALARRAVQVKESVFG